MQRNHRTNILVTSCLKTPVDPYTKAPVALYERERTLPYATRRQMDNRDYEKELEYDFESDGSSEEDGDDNDDESPEKGSALLIKDYRVTGDHIDLREFYFSNEEYYRKLEQLKKAHLHTMAQLERMYRKKLELKGRTAVPGHATERAQQLQVGGGSLMPPVCKLKKSHSAHELGRLSGVSDEDDEEEEEEDEEDENRPEKGLLLSPKERIKNMWRDFAVEDESRTRGRHRHRHHDSSPSLHCQTIQDPYQQDQGLTQGKGRGHQGVRKKVSKKKAVVEYGDGDGCRPRVTMPEPFNMTLREASRKRHGVKTRAEVERENMELRRQLEELTECQKQFRASPVPAHVRLPLYENMRQQEDKRRRAKSEDRQGGASGSATSPQPFSFLERERIKRERREERLRLLAQQEADVERRKSRFRAKPVPRSVREVAAANERLKEEQLYRAIKAQMRARELLHSASMPPSMLARRLEDRKQKEQTAEEKEKKEEDERASHRPKIIGEVPDFDASYRRFQKQLERGKCEAKPLTACEPFRLRTADIPSRRLRSAVATTDVNSSPRDYRWPFLTSPAPSPRRSRRTSCSSLNSSLSGSQEMLTAKITEAARKRQEAIRKALEQKQKAEEEERSWQERQRERERRLQKVISRRAQASDPHLTLAQSCQTKLKEFRKQDQQRRREYREEMKEIQERVKGRPLLLEQVTRNNAKLAAERRYAEALKACGLTEDFVREKALKCKRSRSESPSVCSRQGDGRRWDKDALLSDTVSLDGTPHDYQDDYEDYCDQDQEGGGKEDNEEEEDGEEEEEKNRRGESDHSKSDEGDKSEPERCEDDDDDDDDDLSNDDDDTDHNDNDQEESDRGSDKDHNDNDQEESDRGSDTSDRHRDNQSQGSS
ncbi:hypothetical protein ACEWY4_017626 [Coilia grayii]|uniref:Protein FAM161A n=1 Tax=Coilia grayii TaxID=363190 RepID=A0ABD1JHE0_9TELE